MLCIPGNFGEVFLIWQIGNFAENRKPANIISYTIALWGSVRNRQIENLPMHADD